MSYRGSAHLKRGSFRRSKCEQEMAREDATKSILHNRFIDGLRVDIKGYIPTCIVCISSIISFQSQEIDKENDRNRENIENLDASKIKKEPVSESKLRHNAETKLGMIFFSNKLYNLCYKDELMIEDTMVMDRIHVLQQSLEELTITAKSRASNAGQVG